jgi:hypothetical protein
MRKATIALLTVIIILIVIWFPSQGDASKVFGCYHKEHGQLRVISDHDECLITEEPVPFSEVLNKTEEHCFEVEIEDGTLLGVVRILS